MARQALEYLVDLVHVGGPKPRDYEAVNRSFGRIMGDVRCGLITTSDIRDMWQKMGNAFGPDTMQGHGIRKPHGYAGDFEMIDRIYEHSICDSPDVRRWDEYFQSREACEAVRNRKDFFIALMTSIVPTTEPVRVLNVGSGPARDVCEFFAHKSESASVLIDCVDLDKNAISYATALCHDFSCHVKFHRANIFKWHTKELYRLVWSAGLFDYLDNDTFVVLLRRLASMLEPGGRLVVGNFSPNNPTRDYMEFGEWFLHYRSETELLRLAASCDIPHVTWRVDEEARGINLFLQLERDAEGE